MSILEELNVVFSNYYAFYLKTQNYHWHVKGKDFKTLHETFQLQYEEFATVIDEFAERIVMLGGVAPGSFNAIMKHVKLKDGDASKKATEMVMDLVSDHRLMLDFLKKLEEKAAKTGDSVSEDMAIARAASHQKQIWMLSAYLEK